MKVGIPREIKNHEYRVAITPAGVHELTSHDHDVVIELGAGLGSSIPDEDYIHAGAKILDGVTIGEHAIVGAGAVVRDNIAPRAIADRPAWAPSRGPAVLVGERNKQCAKKLLNTVT